MDLGMCVQEFDSVKFGFDHLEIDNRASPWIGPNGKMRLRINYSTFSCKFWATSRRNLVPWIPVTNLWTHSLASTATQSAERFLSTSSSTISNGGVALPHTMRNAFQQVGDSCAPDDDDSHISNTDVAYFADTFRTVCAVPGSFDHRV